MLEADLNFLQEEFIREIRTYALKWQCPYKEVILFSINAGEGLIKQIFRPQSKKLSKRILP
jgi:hypothetical protein